MADDIRCPSSAELVGIWERGLGRPGHERALMLLEKACPGWSAEDLARWTVGRRDAVLFRLRQALFGEGLASVVRCANCRAEVELSFALSDMWLPGEATAPGKGSVSMAGYDVHYRAPNSQDVAAVLHEPSVGAARLRLLELCIESVSPDGEMPEEVCAAVVSGIAAADPVADRRLNVVCEECGHQWEEIFDIAVWLNSEIATWVRRMLREVHALAAAYGWREEDILNMNPTRRQIYLSILAQA
ncbi:MAG: phage baseplate protein [Candidatus Solibacter sp.]